MPRLQGRTTAEDAAFSLRRALAPATNSPFADFFLTLIQGADDYNAGKVKTLQGVRVVGARTLRITITKPAAYFLTMLAAPQADVLDPAMVRGKPVGSPADRFKGNYLTNACVANQGAGPFTFVCRDRSSNPHSFYAGSKQQYSLLPNRYFYGHKPQIRIELPRLIRNPGAPPAETYKLYLTHRIDVTPLPPAYVRRWRGRSVQYHAFPSSLVYFLTPTCISRPSTMCTAA